MATKHTISRTHGERTQKEHLRTLAKKMNNSLKALEKSGYSKTSRFYKAYQADIEEGRSPWLTTNKKGETVFRSDVSKLTSKQVKEYREFLETRLAFKSRSVREEKKHEQKFEEFFGEGSYKGDASEIVKEVLNELYNRFGSEEARYMYNSAMKKFKTTQQAALFLKQLLFKYTDDETLSKNFYTEIEAVDDEDLYNSDDVDMGWV